MHAQSISACQAVRRDILRDVRVPAEVVRELRRPCGGINVCLAAGRDGHAGKARRGPQVVVESLERRLGAPEVRILTLQTNLAITYSLLGRREEAISLQRDVHSGQIRLFGGSSNAAIIAAQNLVDTLMKLGHHDEALPLLLETIPKSQRVLGKDHDQTFKLQRMYAQILIDRDGASLDDLSLAVATLEDLDRRQRRTLGPDHPQRKMTQVCLDFARKRASARA